jgi:hypothetical protein
MDTLPDEILQEIFSYIDPQSIINISYMNKRINHLAKDTREFKNNDTIEVNTKKCININDINQIVAKIESIFPYIQLKIYLTRTYISDISKLGNVKELNLYDCRNISDFSILGKQELLNVSYTNISDISHLGNVNKLDIQHCKNITDFSILGKQEVLNVSNTNISDISNLGNIKILYLNNCQNITDFSILGKQKVLDISRCRNIIDYTHVENVLILYK